MPTECIDLAKEAATWGVSSAAGGDQKKLALLTDISQGKGESFLKLVADTYEISGPIREVQGACGYAIGSSGYLNHIERIVFPQGLSRAYGVTSGSPDYAGALRSGIHSIADQLQADLEQNTRDNNYITDSTEKRLTEAVSDLSRCGISTFSFDVKIKGLSWYVGGDPGKIQQLQSLLNRLNTGKPLKEDGVYGSKTEAAFESFMDSLHGSVPSLVWVNPLQTSLTGIEFDNISGKGVAALWDKSPTRVETGKPVIVFRPDMEPGGNYHVNTVNGHLIRDGKYTPTELQRTNLNQWNHTPIDEETYQFLKNFDGVSKKIQTAGKVLLVAGIVLDAIELYLTIQSDLHDADQKIGKKTYSELASMGGSWTLGALGAEGGAAIGATIGTAIMPGIGTAVGGFAGGLVLGMVGSFSGSALGRWVIDITVVE